MTADDSTPPDTAVPGPDPQVRVLARVVDRTGRKVSALDTQVRQLAADVTRVAAIIAACRQGPDETPADDETGEGTADGPPAVRSWLLAGDPELATTDLAELIEWLDRVYLRYPDVALTACWLWHPHVIEELWWLRRAHADAYHPEDGSWLRVGDWHDRQRPAVVRRVRDAIGKCDLSLHAAGKPHAQAPLVAPLAAHAARVAVAWTTGGTRPAPTPGQLDEATAYLRTLHRSHR